MILYIEKKHFANRLIWGEKVAKILRKFLLFVFTFAILWYE